MDNKLKFYALFGFNLAGQICYRDVLYFCHLRGRRRRAPITHVFNRVRIDPTSALIEFAERSIDKFDFLTVWAMAREVLMHAALRLEVAQLKTNVVHTSFFADIAALDNEIGLEISPIPLLELQHRRTRT